MFFVNEEHAVVADPCKHFVYVWLFDTLLVLHGCYDGHDSTAVFVRFETTLPIMLDHLHINWQRLIESCRSWINRYILLCLAKLDRS